MKEEERTLTTRKWRENQVFYPVNPSVATALSLFQEALEWIIFRNSETKLQGVENLERVRLLVAEGKPVVLTPNHLSLADHPYIKFFLHHYRFVDLWDKIIFVGRKSLYRSPLLRPFLATTSAIGVYSPREVELMNEEERKEAAKHNGLALRTAWEKLKEGRILVVNPEGRRSRTGALIRGQEAVASFWHVPGGQVVPMGIWGTERVFSTQFFNAPSMMAVGEPIPVASLREQANHNKQREVDLVMEEIASLLPNHYRGVYYHDRVV